MSCACLSFCSIVFIHQLLSGNELMTLTSKTTKMDSLAPVLLLPI